MPQPFPTMFAVGKLSPGTSRGDAPLAGALRAWDPGPSAERLCSGSCSAGAGPTGGTNAFASRGAAPSPRSPGRTARARKGCRRAPLGAGRVRGPGSGVRRRGLGSRRGSRGRGAETALRFGRRALCWPAADSPAGYGTALPARGLGRCRLGRRRVGWRLAGRGLARPSGGRTGLDRCRDWGLLVQRWAELAMGWVGLR